MKLFRFEKNGSIGIGMLNKVGKQIDISAFGHDINEQFFET